MAIDSVARTTCGGPQVRSTAEVETVKLLGTEPMRGGTRLHWIAGARVRERLAIHEARAAELAREVVADLCGLPRDLGRVLTAAAQHDERPARRNKPAQPRCERWPQRDRHRARHVPGGKLGDRPDVSVLYPDVCFASLQAVGEMPIDLLIDSVLSGWRPEDHLTAPAGADATPSIAAPTKWMICLATSNSRSSALSPSSSIPSRGAASSAISRARSRPIADI